MKRKGIAPSIACSMFPNEIKQRIHHPLHGEGNLVEIRQEEYAIKLDWTRAPRRLHYVHFCQIQKVSLVGPWLRHTAQLRAYFNELQLENAVNAFDVSLTCLRGFKRIYISTDSYEKKSSSEATPAFMKFRPLLTSLPENTSCLAIMLTLWL